MENLPKDLKNGPLESKGHICDLTLVADHLFFTEVGEGSLEKTVLQVLWHVKVKLPQSHPY